MLQLLFGSYNPIFMVWASSGIRSLIEVPSIVHMILERTLFIEDVLGFSIWNLSRLMEEFRLLDVNTIDNERAIYILDL